MQKNKAGMGQKMILLKINKLKTLFFPVSPVDPLAIIGEDSTKRAKKQKQNKKQQKKILGQGGKAVYFTVTILNNEKLNHFLKNEVIFSKRLLFELNKKRLRVSLIHCEKFKVNNQ